MVDWATPEVDTLSALKLDQQLLNQVPFKVKTFGQEKDKEMFNVQRAFLNATVNTGQFRPHNTSHNRHRVFYKPHWVDVR